MANRKSGSRQSKINKTIDLKANKVEEEAVDTKPEQAQETSSGYHILKEKSEPASNADIADGEKKASGASNEAVTEKLETSDAAENSGEQPEMTNESEPVPTAAPAAKSRGMGSMILSAILGGGVALGGASLIGQNSTLQSVPVIGGLFKGADQNSESNAKIEALGAQLSDLAAQLESVKAAPVSDPAAAEALELAKAAQSASQAATDKIAEITNQMIENPNGSPIDLDGLKAALAGEQAELVERIAALETAETGQLPQALQDELSGIKEQVTKLDALEKSTKDLGQSLADMDLRIKAVETSINENVLPSMESVQAAAGAAVESQKVARSVSARALGAVLENGGSFAGELAAAEALIGQSENISALKSLAGKGILNQAALTAEFDQAADRIIAAGVDDNEDQGFVGKLMSSAKTLVKVRPAGPVSGDTNGAIVSRIAASLGEGNLTEALNQWDSFNDDAKAASGDWESKARERAQAETYINNIIGELGQSSPNQG